MEEIANQFREELQYLIDRYKNRLTVPRIMHVAQDVFHKTLSIKHHPELHTAALNFLQSTKYTKPDLEGKWKSLYNIQNEQGEGDWKCESNTDKPM